MRDGQGRGAAPAASVTARHDLMMRAVVLTGPLQSATAALPGDSQRPTPVIMNDAPNRQTCT